VEKGVGLAKKASASLETIVTSSGHALDMVQRIATATEQQSAASEEVTQSMENISGIAKNTSTAMEQIKVSAQELARLAADLKTTAAWFKVSAADNRQPTPVARPQKETVMPETARLLQSI
jgi:methyl-accepting chemotaxis protein